MQEEKLLWMENFGVKITKNCRRATSLTPNVMEKDVENFRKKQRSFIKVA